MKTAIFFCRFLILVLLIFAMVVCSSCGHKPTTSSVEKDTLEVKNFSNIHFSNQLQRSLAVNDVFQFKFPYVVTGATQLQDCDSLCNQKIKQALTSVYTEKNSGNNSYKIYYDKYNDLLVFNTKIGETVNQYKDSVVILKNQLKQTKSATTEIPVEKLLTKTQLFFLCSGVTFWILLLVVIGWKTYKYFNPIKTI